MRQHPVAFLVELVLTGISQYHYGEVLEVTGGKFWKPFGPELEATLKQFLLGPNFWGGSQTIDF